MEIIVTKSETGRNYFLYRDSRAEYFESEYETRLGNIYAGIVTRIKKDIGAAFVQIGNDGKDTGFLPLKEIPDAAVLNRDYSEHPALKTGDVLLVQLTAEEESGKKPRLKCTPALSGRFAVVTLGRKGLGCSKSIHGDQKKELLGAVRKDKELMANADSFGILLRTECAYNSSRKKDIIAEIRQFEALFKEFIETKTSSPKLLYERPHEEKMLEHLMNMLHFSQRLMLSESGDQQKGNRTDKVRIIAQNAALQSEVRNCGFTYMRPEIEVLTAGNEDDLVNRTLKVYRELMSGNVWLNSGGILYFDKTRAMHVIDVNTARTELKGNPDAKDGRKTLAEKISLEAADMIMRQIRMRNLSGIILIDFPDMPRAAFTRVLKRLRSLAELDFSDTKVHDITQLGIAEITRARTGKEIRDIL